VEEKIKGRIILGLVILNLLFLFGMVNSCTKSCQTRIARDKEMTIRFDAQEKLDSVQRENSFLENKLKKAEDSVKSVNTGLEAAQKSLVQEQQINQDLRAEIEKVTRLKESLEETLKNINAGKSGRQSRK
jgi:predicted RNase H-like nuclease (RuvC/YqgF family)